MTVIVAMSGLALTQTAHAVGWDFAPEAEARIGYNDNIRLRERGASGTTEGRARVGIRAERRTETLDTRLRGTVGYVVYDGSEDAPDNDDFQQLQSDITLSHENTTWEFAGSADRDSSLVIVGRDFADPELDPDPGSDIDARDREETITRYRVLARPSVTHQITDRTSAGAAYAGRYLGYDDDVAGDIESLNHEFSLFTDYAATERATVGLSLSSGLFRPRTGDRDLNSYGAGLRYGYALTERSAVRLSAGMIHSEPAVSSSDIERSTGFVGRAQGFTRGDNWRGDMTLERRLLPSSRGGMNETDQVLLSASRELSPRWEASFLGRAFTTRPVGESPLPGSTRHYGSLRPSLGYRLTPDWTASGEYELRVLRRKDRPGEALGNAVFLQIAYEPRRRAPEF